MLADESGEDQRHYALVSSDIKDSGTTLKL